MGNGQDFQDLIDRLAAAATDAREAVREAHEATQAAKEQRRELERVSKEVEEYVRGLVAREYESSIAPTIQAGLRNYNDAVQRAVNAKAKQINSAFGKLTNLLLYGSDHPRRDTFIAPKGHPAEPAFRQFESDVKRPPDPADG